MPRDRDPTVSVLLRRAHFTGHRVLEAHRVVAGVRMPLLFRAGRCPTGGDTTWCAPARGHLVSSAPGLLRMMLRRRFLRGKKSLEIEIYKAVGLFQ